MTLLLLPLFAVLWRFQGGAWFASRLPGRPVWYVAPILGLATGLLQADWKLGLATALAILWCSLIPHGRWYTLGRAPRDLAGPPNGFEKLVERLSGKSDHLALIIAKIIASVGYLGAAFLSGSTPAMIAALVLPLAIVAAYEIGWRISRTGTHVGEWLTGAAFGVVAASL